MKPKKKNPLLIVCLSHNVPAQSTTFDLPTLQNYENRTLVGLSIRYGGATSRRAASGRQLLPATVMDAAVVTIKSGTEEMASFPAELASFDKLQNSNQQYFELNLKNWVWNNSGITFWTPPASAGDVEFTLFLENESENR